MLSEIAQMEKKLLVVEISDWDWDHTEKYAERKRSVVH